MDIHMYSARTAHSICIYIHMHTHISPRADSSVEKRHGVRSWACPSSPACPVSRTCTAFWRETRLQYYSHAGCYIYYCSDYWASCRRWTPRECGVSHD